MFCVRPFLRACPPSVAWVATLIIAMTIAIPTSAAPDPASLIADGGFHLTGSGPTRSSIVCAATPTAAPDWLTWNNDPVTTSTELIPDTLLGRDGWMLHVTVVGTSLMQGSGIYRPYAAVDTGPMRVRALVWVYVLSGRVGVGAGNGGNTGIGAATSTIGRWELLRAFNGVAPANEIIIYAVDRSAEFYIGSVTVEATEW
jgi:hypothetical protein